MDESVENIVQQIMEEADVEKEELMKKIEEKQEELSGFLTPEGAATIIARNYGVVPEREEPEIQKLRIEDLSLGMSNIDVVGRIVRILEPREFDRRDGSKGKVANLVLEDKTGQIRVVLWDRMVGLVAEEEIQKGVPIRLEGAYIKKGRNGSPELNIGRRGKIEVDPEGERAEDLPPASDTTVKISEIDSDIELADVVGRVTAVTAPREFERSDGSKGKVASLRIADETGQTRVSLWNDQAEKTEKINPGDAIRLENASVREGWKNAPELHLNWQGRLVQNPKPKEVEDLPEFEKKILKIEEIEADMPILDVAGVVKRKFPPTEFNRDDGSSGRVMNLILADETGTIRVSFWDDMVKIAEDLSSGDIILIENARSSAGLNDRPEIRIGQRSNVNVNPENIDIEEPKPSKVDMSELEEGLDSLEVTGRVIESSEAKDFTRDDGSKGKVASMTIGDDTGTAKLTLWGKNTDVLNELDAGDIIQVENAYSVSGNYGEPEIHVGGQAKLKINPESGDDLPSVEEINKSLPEKSQVKIKEVEEGSQIQIRGTIVRVFERRPLFSVCPECGRALGSENSESLCEKCGEVVEPDYRVVVNTVVDDGSDNIRGVAFGKLGEKLLGKTADEISEALSKEDELSELYKEIDLEGREVTLIGNVRRDDYFDQLELSIRDLRFPDPIEEAQKMLEKIKA